MWPSSSLFYEGMGSAEPCGSLQGTGTVSQGGSGWSHRSRAMVLGAGRGCITSIRQTAASPDLHTFLLPHCSRWMSPWQCCNEQKRKQISQPPAPLAAHEPSVPGTAAATAVP